MKKAILVLGMHRSGTSAISGILHHLGIDMGKGLMSPSKDNPKGYFEVQAIRQFNDLSLLPALDSSWDTVLFPDREWYESQLIRDLENKAQEIVRKEYADSEIIGIKDPRICRLFPFWFKILRSLNFKVKVLFIYRNPVEVTCSLKARDNFSMEKGLLLWANYLLLAEFFSRDLERQFINYQEAIDCPLEISKKVISGLQLDINMEGKEDSITNWIDKGLRRQNSRVYQEDLPDFITHSKEIFEQLVSGNAVENYQAVLDNLRTKLKINCRFFQRALDLVPGCSARLPGRTRSNTINQKTASQEQEGIYKGLANRQHDESEVGGEIKKRERVPCISREIWQNELQYWKTLPVFGIYLDLSRSNLEKLADTIDSLALQLYPQWKLTVISPAACPDPVSFQHENLRWVEIQEGFWATVNRLKTETREDWLMFLQAGDQLTAHCLVSMVSLINQERDAAVIYSDHDLLHEAEGSIPVFKPDFNLDMLCSFNYINRSFSVKKEFLDSVGWFDPRLRFAEQFDLLLRAADAASTDEFVHIPDVLFSLIESSPSDQHEMEMKQVASKLAIQRHLNRNALPSVVADGAIPYTFRCLYDYDPEALVSIIIPTKNQVGFLKTCVESLFAKTSYKNFELLIVDNNSDETEILDLFEELRKKYGDKVKVLPYKKKFNYSEANNIAAQAAKGEYLLLLNNDTEIIQEKWLDILVSYCQRKGVGAVGARLLFPDGRIQHAGVVAGLYGMADHVFTGCSPEEAGYMNRLQVDQNYSAVTAACMLVKREAFEKVEGLDHKNYQVNFSDVDFCLKLGQAGYRIVWTPHVSLIHHTSATQKKEAEDPARAKEAKEQFENDKEALIDRWFPVLCHDPAYNYNLDLGSRHFGIDSTEFPGWSPAIFSVPRIWAYPRAKDGSGEYRLRRPMLTMQENGLALTHLSEHFMVPNIIEKHRPDTLVFQTPLSDENIYYLRLMRRYFKGIIIFEIDDLIHRIPYKNPAFENLGRKNMKKQIARAMKYCDRMVVSTKPLAMAYSDLCRDIRVVPNYISSAVWGNLDSKPSGNGRPRVGWAGAVFHYGDLMVIKDVVKELADEVDWIFMGMCPDELRPYVAEYHEGVDIDKYPAKLATLKLDLALAPLEINAFNEGKSNLRILEYGILGWPVVATNIYPYRNAPVTLVKNRYKDWVKAIMANLNDLNGIAQKGSRLRQWVLDNWMLEDNLENILKEYV